MEEHSGLKGNYPFNQIFNAIENILADGVVSGEEEQELLALIHESTNPKVENHSKTIDFKGKICCLTGTFTNGIKSEIEQLIIRKGGSCIPCLNKSVN